MIKKISFLTLILAAVLLSSCHRGEKIEYFPFQQEEDGKYGLISPDGKVILPEHFKNCPTVATDGRFWVLNDDGYFELYEAKDDPRKIGTEYRYVSPFFEGRAIVAERDKEISIIDRNGDVKAELGKIGDYTPDYITAMSEGHAVFAVDTLQGIVNYKGEMLVKPKYFSIAPMHDGYMVAVSANYAMSADAEGYDEKAPKGFASVINKYGEVALKISNKKYPRVSQRVFGDLLPVGQYSKKHYRWGIVNLKGETVVEPSKKYRMIGEISGDYFTFMDDDRNWGVASLKDGSVVLKPQYSVLFFSGPEVLCAAKEETLAENGMMRGSGKFISTDGATISEYEATTGMLPPEYKHAFISTGQGKWKIITDKGEPVQSDAKIYSLSSNRGNDMIMSDYIDIPDFVSALGIDATGIDSLSFSTGVKKALERQARYFSSSNKPKAADYATSKEVAIYRTVDGESITEEVVYPGPLSHQTFTTRTYVDSYNYYDYWYGGWYTNYYTYDRKVPAGFAFSTSTPRAFRLTFSNYGKLRGKLKPLLKKISSKFKNMGTLEQENSGAVLVKLNNGKQAVAYINGNNLYVVWGDLTMEEKNISRWDGSKETVNTNPVFNDFLNEEAIGE